MQWEGLFPTNTDFIVNDITTSTAWTSGETYVVCMHMDKWKASEVAAGATLTVHAGARWKPGIGFCNAGCPSAGRFAPRGEPGKTGAIITDGRIEF